MNVTKDITDQFNSWTIDFNNVPDSVLAKTREVTMLKNFITLLSTNQVTMSDAISASKVIIERLRFI